MSKVMLLPVHASWMAFRKEPGPLSALVVTTGSVKQSTSVPEVELSFSELGSVELVVTVAGNE